MDLHALDIDTIKPGPLIEGYDSLIWTERFAECGDFVLMTGRVNDTRKKLPEGSLCKITESQEIMIVDSHKITTDENGKTLLRIEGRSLETIFENRPAIKDLNPLKDAEYHISGETPHATAAQILTKVPEGLSPEWAEAWVRPIFVARPEDNPEFTIDYQVPRGTQYDAVLQLARSYGFGLRNGIYFYGPEPRLFTSLYYGTDRAIGNKLGNSPVIFSSDRGDFSSEDFFMDYRSYKNAAIIFTANLAQGYYIKTPNSTIPKGLKLRVLYMDGDDIKPPTEIGVRNSIDYERDLGSERLFSELSQRKLEPDVTFQVSKDSSYRYGVDGDYFLGDTITVHTGYGGRKNLQVSEYIRSEDGTGETAYPTMIEVPKLEGVFTEL